MYKEGVCLWSIYFSDQIFTGRISAGALHPELGAKVQKREGPVGKSENKEQRCIKYWGGCQSSVKVYFSLEKMRPQDFQMQKR